MDYLGVDTDIMAETAVTTALVMAPVMAMRNAAGTALVFVGAVASSSVLAFTAALSSAFLFTRAAIIQPL